MDVALFHQALLGIDQIQTDPEFRLTSQHKRLYQGFASHGARGFAGSDVSEGRFLATLVLALYQTRLPEDKATHEVAILMPKTLVPLYRDRLEAVMRYVFRQRKGDRPGARILKQAFGSLKRAHRLLQINEPARWVIVGFEADTFLPSWAQGHML